MKKLIPLTLGLALVAATGVAFAETAAKTDTAKQTATSSANEGGWHGHGKHGGEKGMHRMDNSALLTLLKLDESKLHEQLAAGKSLADIATAQGVTKQQVIDTITKQMNDHLAQEVRDGEMTQEQANTRKTELKTKIAAMVDQKGGFAGGREGHGGKGHFGRGGKIEDVASVLGLSVDELLTQLKTGKSIAEIAKAKGFSEQQLLDGLMKKQKDRISNWINEKKSTGSNQ